MWTAAADDCRRRGRPRKNHRKPAGRPLRSPPTSRLRLRRRQRPLRDDFSDIEGDESEREHEHEYEYDESDGEHERRRVKKKLKLLLKLHRPSSPPRREPSPASSVSFPTDESGSEDGECRSRKQRRGRGRRGAGDREVERKQRGCNRKVYASESSTPLPDQKTLESILDKIQMKDKYGVFGEPVDLDELPDYLEIIEHPMDFGTIRKKLARKFFANLEEFEADVYLVCNNAMQYNAPETVYHKQARSMHEVAKKSFQSIRAESRSCATFCKTELNDFPRSLEKDQPESSNIIPLEKAGSEISSIAVTINEDDGMGLGAMERTGSEKPIKDTVVAVVEACSTIERSETPHLEETKQSFNLKEDPHQSGTDQEVTDILMEKVEKVEEISEKGTLSNNGPKLDSADESCHTVDENRRATYNISNQPTVCQHDSVFSIFEAEEKQLVAVGLDAEYSYARSLARFSATLGPIGWRIASEKIEKALPPGVKFGPGWVGEYEPLPTPILSVVQNILRNDKKSSLVHEAPVKGSSQRKEEHNNVDRDRKESTEDKQNVPLKAKHNVATSVQMCMPCRVTSPLVEGQAPISTVNKSNGEGNVERKLGAFQVSSRHQLTMSNDLVRPQRDKSAGVPWIDQTIENGKANFPKSESNVNSSLARNGLDSASKKPQFLIETANTRYMTPVGFKSPTESESRKGVWISTNQAPMSANTGFPTNRDLRNLCQSPISMSSEKKDAANSCNRDGTSTSSMSCSGEAMHNPHANATAAQVTKDSLHSMKMMPGNMPKLQNYTSSVITNSTRQFIPALSPRYPPNSISGTESGSGGITHSDSTATIPMNAWISIGNYSERKSTEAPGFLKVQAEPHIYRPCVSSLASGMYQVTGGRQLLPSSNSHTTNGRSLLPLTSQMVSEKSDLQKSSLASTPLISSELSKPQHMFSWRDPMANGQQRKSEDMLPPDLNIGFQSPGSPVQRSSGIRVDSQPDLALQL